ncbi:hypothetical protein L204_104430 [Cryptococcus depauperatus]|nr:hypothetical protein L204_06420 [Cryptococcus depauperatus CBS 7855]
MHRDTNHFATSTASFNLPAAPSTALLPNNGKGKVCRPSMLSLTQDAGDSNYEGKQPPMIELIKDPSSSKAIKQLIQQEDENSVPLQPMPRWSASAKPIQNGLLKRSISTSMIPLEGLKTSTPPARLNIASEDNEKRQDTEMADSSRLSLDHSLEGNRSSHQSTFNSARPLPFALVQTLILESDPHKHEIQSEARLQRLILSHPSKLPLTPRAPRGSRGRFPDQVEDDDDELASFNVPLAGGARRWGGWTEREESDSDDDDDPTPEEGGEVERAWAGIMDMDQPELSHPLTSQSGLARATESEPNQGQIHINPSYPLPTPHAQAQSHPTTQNPAQQTPVSAIKSGRLGMGIVPSPGYGLQTAFTTLGMGSGTPIGSPNVERSELGASPNAPMSSPGLMQYRESSSFRTGKRKAVQDDRFDPYKRPRGTSPSFNSHPSSSPFPLSPSRPTSISIPSIPASPSHAPLYPSSLGASGGGSNLSRLSHSHGQQTHPSGSRPNHPYTRPAIARSRAVSPALSASLGNVTGTGPISATGAGLGLSGGSWGASGTRSSFLAQVGKARERKRERKIREEQVLGINLGGLDGLGGGDRTGAGAKEIGGLGLLSLKNQVREDDEDGEHVFCITKADREGANGEDARREKDDEMEED